MIIQGWMIATFITIVVNFVIIAFGYGKLNQKAEATAKAVAETGIADIVSRVKALETEIRAIDDLKNSVTSISQTLYELKGMMEMYIKLMCKDKFTQE